MPHINFIRADIEHRRRQVARLRGDIRKLQHSGISSASADALLERMLKQIDELRAERNSRKPLPNREQSDTDQLEAAADHAIAVCGGDAREAIKALIVANDF